MATLHQCDRCEKLFKLSREVKSISLPALNKWKDSFDDVRDDVIKELCLSCVLVIYIALEKPPLAAPTSSYKIEETPEQAPDRPEPLDDIPF